MTSDSCSRGKCEPKEPGEFSWHEALHECGPVMLRIAYSILGDEDEAKDCVQIAFIRLFKTIERYDPTKDPRPYLIAITRNVAFDEYKKKGRNALPIDLIEETFSSGAVVEDTILQDLVLENAVRKIIEQTGLNPYQATVFVYSTVYGMKPKEIACFVGKTSREVSKTLSRARAKIREKLDRNALFELLNGDDEA